MEELPSADIRPGHTPLYLENERLKRELVSLLNLIDDDSRKNALSSRIDCQKSSREEMKRELELTNDRIAKLRLEIDRIHQTSSLRSVEDHMRATRKELGLVKGEIQVLLQEASRQRRVLESHGSHQLIKSLEQEIANERLIYSHLKREALAIGIPAHKTSKPSTV